MYEDIHQLLILGVETNPGPINKELKIAHVNINSVTAPGWLDELHFFLNEHNIDILALSETKLDDAVHHSLFNLPNFHAPYTKHRTRQGGRVAVYTRRHMSTRRLSTSNMHQICSNHLET